MRKIIIMYVFVLLLLFIPKKVNAECSSEEVKRLSRMANNINISVQFDDLTKRFSITLLNLTNDFVIEHKNNGELYESHYELVLENVDSGSHIFSIHDMNGCYKDEITTKNVYVPYYNKYYQNKECEKNKNYVYCSKWLKSEVTYKTWKNKVDNYTKVKKTIIFDDEEEKDKKTTGDFIAEFFVTLYVEHYYVFLPIIIISFIAIIYLKNKSENIIYRKNKHEDITL